MSGLEPETLEETRARLARVGAPASPPRRPAGWLIAALAIVLAVGGIGVAVFALLGLPPSSPDWSSYPGSAYRDSAEVLAGQTVEEVSADAQSRLEAIREALTDELGITWTQVYDETQARDLNYYGGESLLYIWDSGTWRGEVATSDPDARQKVEALFASFVAEGNDYSAWNDLVPAGDALTLEQYGLGDKSSQALWSLTSHDARNNVSFSLDVYDSTVPVGETFVGADQFSIPEGDTNTLYISLFANGQALLSDADLAEFQRLLQPYVGQDKPAPTG